jgi:solute carrier family 25 phosphate transporter 3
MCPLDVVKCNAQTDAEHFGKGAVRGLQYIYSGEAASLGFNSGVRGVLKGWGPTLVGYSFQGAGKYGFYELFAYKYSHWMGEKAAEKYRPLIWAAASASAEFFADIALCPFEAVKVRIQTNPTYAKGLMDGMTKMARTEGMSTLYAGIVPLWARQIPYTVVKFVAFEGIAEEIYRRLKWKKEETSKLGQLGVVFSAGYIAGILCATASHPADVLVSKINKVNTQGGIVEKAKLIVNGNGKDIKGIGFRGLWVGLPTRIVMIGTLTGLQWLLYGTFKAYVGLPTPGGH